jgi:anti-sigma regulatory factor (Ser/Thr protein kinase)
MKTTRSFVHAPASVTAARRFATEALRGAPAETLEAVALMVSELATNCVRHTDGGFELTILRSPGEIRVEATDHGGGKPTMRSPEPTDPTGRGLRIVDMLARAWGVDRTGQATTVWFTIASGGASRKPSSRAADKRTARRRTVWPSGQLGDDHRRVRRHEAPAVWLRGYQHLAYPVKVPDHTDVARSIRRDGEQRAGRRWRAARSF